ncbi:MAG TPA: WecB/TagA/CpsF family glycosyltransferase [Phycisphaerae bacterium]|nr:WecB/TagA/CpsF family glycosyltransferase [Phycisphaerae bacterium]HNU44563.1 WecB/TagA/CpsF family glycosyltransferase [Phycisphaerae bacterium]
MTCDNAWPTRTLFGLPVHALTMQDVLTIAEDVIAQRRRLLIGVVNAAKIVSMRQNPRLDQAVRTADMILADGISVVWAARLLRRSLPERVTGIDLMYRLLERGSERGWRVFCLGATEEVLAEVVRCINARYPGVVVAGQHHGYFKSEDETGVANAIRAARPDMLFVAMSSPRKEEFLARFNGELDVPLCHGVGGSFDVMAGKVKRAPRIWQRLGLEWLYRVVQEPGRMWRRYLVSNSIFCWLVLKELCARSRTPETV